MTTPTLLDPRTGRPEVRRGEVLAPSGRPFSFEKNLAAGWRQKDPEDFASRWSADQALMESVDGMIPAKVMDLLEKDRALAPAERPQASGNFYLQPLYWIIADGTQIVNTTTEAILVPAFTLPAGYLQPGSTLRYTVYFDLSTVATTPGTITQRLRYNGTGGTALATSGAFAGTTTVKSTLSCRTTYLLTCRSIGTGGTVFVVGDTLLPNIDPTSAATIAANLAMYPIPVSGAATASVNTTTANTLDPTLQFSVVTATTQATCHLALLESIV